MVINGPNIAFRRFEDITSKVSRPHNLKNTTAIFVNCTNVKKKLVGKYAEIMLKAGCRSFVFEGSEAEQWHYEFDLKDISLTHDSEDVALTSTLDHLEELPDELLISEGNVLIYNRKLKIKPDDVYEVIEID